METMEAIILGHLDWTSPAQVLVASIWQGTLLALCVWLGLRLMDACGQALRASTRFALWLIVFLLVASLPAFVLVKSVLAGPTTFPAAVAEGSFHLSSSWGLALGILWACASVFSLARLVTGGLRMRALLKASNPVAFEDLEAGLRTALSRPGKHPVALLLSNAVDSPGAIGFFRPAVVMPRSLWAELNPAELRQILLHEMAHIQRGDGWTNLLQKLLRALCPLNPALFWAERALCRERERACDDRVLEVEGNPRAYATCLTRLAESRLIRRAAALAPGLWKRPSELAARVDDILHRRPSLGPVLSRGVLAVSLIASLTGAVVLQRCPSLVSFTSSQPPSTRAALSEGDLASATLVRTSVRSHSLPVAGYHDAVFHPEANRLLATPAVAKPAKTIAKPTLKVNRRLAHKPQAAPRLRLADFDAAPGDSPVFTLILITVEMPANGRVPQGMLPLAFIPGFSLSHSWITIQI